MSINPNYRKGDSPPMTFLHNNNSNNFAAASFEVLADRAEREICLSDASPGSIRRTPKRRSSSRSRGSAEATLRSTAGSLMSPSSTSRLGRKTKKTAIKSRSRSKSLRNADRTGRDLYDKSPGERARIHVDKLNRLNSENNNNHATHSARQFNLASEIPGDSGLPPSPRPRQPMPPPAAPSRPPHIGGTYLPSSPSLRTEVRGTISFAKQEDGSHKKNENNAVTMFTDARFATPRDAALSPYGAGLAPAATQQLLLNALHALQTGNHNPGLPVSPKCCSGETARRGVPVVGDLESSLGAVPVFDSLTAYLSSHFPETGDAHGDGPERVAQLLLRSLSLGQIQQGYDQQFLMQNSPTLRQILNSAAQEDSQACTAQDNDRCIRKGGESFVNKNANRVYRVASRTDQESAETALVADSELIFERTHADTSPGFAPVNSARERSNGAGKEEVIPVSDNFLSKLLRMLPGRKETANHDGNSGDSESSEGDFRLSMGAYSQRDGYVPNVPAEGDHIIQQVRSAREQSANVSVDIAGSEVRTDRSLTGYKHLTANSKPQLIDGRELSGASQSEVFDGSQRLYAPSHAHAAFTTHTVVESLSSESAVSSLRDNKLSVVPGGNRSQYGSSVRATFRVDSESSQALGSESASSSAGGGFCFRRGSQDRFVTCNPSSFCESRLANDLNNVRNGSFRANESLAGSRPEFAPLGRLRTAEDSDTAPSPPYSRVESLASTPEREQNANVREKQPGVHVKFDTAKSMQKSAPRSRVDNAGERTEDARRPGSRNRSQRERIADSPSATDILLQASQGSSLQPAAASVSLRPCSQRERSTSPQAIVPSSSRIPTARFAIAPRRRTQPAIVGETRPAVMNRPSAEPVANSSRTSKVFDPEESHSAVRAATRALRRSSSLNSSVRTSSRDESGSVRAGSRMSSQGPWAASAASSRRSQQRERPASLIARAQATNCELSPNSPSLSNSNKFLMMQAAAGLRGSLSQIRAPDPILKSRERSRSSLPVHSQPTAKSAANPPESPTTSDLMLMNSSSPLRRPQTNGGLIIPFAVNDSFARPSSQQNSQQLAVISPPPQVPSYSPPRAPVQHMIVNQVHESTGVNDSAIRSPPRGAAAVSSFATRIDRSQHHALSASNSPSGANVRRVLNGASFESHAVSPKWTSSQRWRGPASPSPSVGLPSDNSPEVQTVVHAMASPMFAAVSDRSQQHGTLNASFCAIIEHPENRKWQNLTGRSAISQKSRPNSATVPLKEAASPSIMQLSSHYPASRQVSPENSKNIVSLEAAVLTPAETEILMPKSERSASCFAPCQAACTADETANVLANEFVDEGVVPLGLASGDDYFSTEEENEFLMRFAADHVRPTERVSNAPLLCAPPPLLKGRLSCSDVRTSPHFSDSIDITQLLTSATQKQSESTSNSACVDLRSSLSALSELPPPPPGVSLEDHIKNSAGLIAALLSQKSAKPAAVSVGAPPVSPGSSSVGSLGRPNSVRRVRKYAPQTLASVADATQLLLEDVNQGAANWEPKNQSLRQSPQPPGYDDFPVLSTVVASPPASPQPIPVRNMPSASGGMSIALYSSFAPPLGSLAHANPGKIVRGLPSQSIKVTCDSGSQIIVESPRRFDAAITEVTVSRGANSQTTRGIVSRIEHTSKVPPLPLTCGSYSPIRVAYPSSQVPNCELPAVSSPQGVFSQVSSVPIHAVRPLRSPSPKFRTTHRDPSPVIGSPAYTISRPAGSSRVVRNSLADSSVGFAVSSPAVNLPRGGNPWGGSVVFNRSQMFESSTGYSARGDGPTRGLGSQASPPHTTRSTSGAVEAGDEAGLWVQTPVSTVYNRAIAKETVATSTRNFKNETRFPESHFTSNSSAHSTHNTFVKNEPGTFPVGNSKNSISSDNKYSDSDSDTKKKNAGKATRLTNVEEHSSSFDESAVAAQIQEMRKLYRGLREEIKSLRSKVH